jgi:hypothetical protein
MSTGWATFLHSVLDGVNHNPFLFYADQCTYLNFFFLVFGCFSLRPNLTHRYVTHLLTFINTAPTLVPYLSPTGIAILITSYLINPTTILTTYLINLTTLLITYLINLNFFTNLTTILTTYPIDLTTLHT